MIGPVSCGVKGVIYFRMSHDDDSVKGSKHSKDSVDQKRRSDFEIFLGVYQKWLHETDILVFKLSILTRGLTQAP